MHRIYLDHNASTRDPAKKVNFPKPIGELEVEALRDPDVTGRLQARHTTVLRTDLDGLATIRTDGTQLHYWIQTWQQPSKILGLPEHLVH